MSKFGRISLNRSNAGHKAALKKINRVMISKCGFYKKGEWESLEKRRMYHVGVHQRQRYYNRVLTKDEKKSLWNNIVVNSY